MILTENKNRITYRFYREARSPISRGIFPVIPLLTMYLYSNIEAITNIQVYVNFMNKQFIIRKPHLHGIKIQKVHYPAKPTFQVKKVVASNLL
jgi:hypothetical protein